MIVVNLAAFGVPVAAQQSTGDLNNCRGIRIHTKLPGSEPDEPVLKCDTLVQIGARFGGLRGRI